MASGAVTAPQFQVDIVGLSSWMTSLGTRGLKQLATSGVAVHTVGCMLMISELTPTSMEFRKQLNRVRQVQRSERSWYFTTVEIGAGTNFLADQMLKTRAGENVMALLTAIAPVMNETACTNVLSLLFDLTNVALDNTPGVGELEKIRSALLPLARRIDFKEKVLQFHCLLRGFAKLEWQINQNQYEAIPNEQDMPKLIMLLFKVATNEEYLLDFSGIRGAGWVAAYASCILGLETCIVNAYGHTLPISGKYEAAKVLIRPCADASEERCELRKAGNVEDFISETTMTEQSKSGWSVDCSLISYVDINMPALSNKPELYILSQLTASLTFDRIAELAEVFIKPAFSRKEVGSFGPVPFRPYIYTQLPYLRERALEILRILGFETGDVDEFYNRNNCPNLDWKELCGSEYLDHPEWKTYITHRRHVNSPDQAIKLLQDCVKIAGISKSFLKGFAEKNPVVARTLTFADWSIDNWSQIATSLANAADMAARLAFTNWGKCVRMMSVSSFHARGLTSVSAARTRPIFGFRGHLASTITLCLDSFGPTRLEKTFRSADWVCIDIDGLVLLRSRVVQRSLLNNEINYIDFHVGRIAFEDTVCESIRAEPNQRFCTLRLPNRIAIPGSVHLRRTATTGHVEFSTSNSLKLVIKQSCTLSQRTLWLVLECLVADNTWVSPDLISIMDSIPNLWVTSPCTHPFNTPAKLPTYGALELNFYNCIEASQTEAERPCDLKPQGVFRICHSESFGSPEASWLACVALEAAVVSNPRDRSLCVLQKDTCLLCTYHQLELYGVRHKNYGINVFNVIPEKSKISQSSTESLHEPHFEACQAFRSHTTRHVVDLGCPSSDHTPCCLAISRQPLLRRSACVGCAPYYFSASCQECENMEESELAGDARNRVRRFQRLMPLRF